MNRARIIPILLLIGLLGAADKAAPATAAGIKAGKAFEEMLLLDQGRVKPMDSFARKFLLGLSGRSSFKGQSASDWMARLLFDPGSTVQDAVFRVNNEETITAMGLRLPTARRYSFRQLEDGLERLDEIARAAYGKPEKERSLVEKEAIGLYMNVSSYQALANSFAFADPRRRIEIGVEKNRALFGLKPGETLTLPVFLSKRREIQALMPAPDKHGGHAGGPDVQELFQIMMWVESMRPMQGLPGLDMLPDYRDGSERWHSPWNYLTEINDHSQEAVLSALPGAFAAWNASDAKAFDLALESLNREVARAIPASAAMPKAGLERFHNKLDAFYKAEILYGLAFLLLLVFLLLPRTLLLRGATAALALGAALNLAGVALRTILTARAPVTNLFETFVFVGLTAAVLGLILERFNKQGIGILTGSITALGMLLISGNYSADGDTMGPMVAVLRSNFWLSTHVLTITIGYAGVVLAGIIAHVHLVQAMRRSTEPAAMENTMRMLYGALAVGFIFTFVGTVLGGVWADQSWGRFWGWDPKENGALAIVLWTSIILHARLSKLVSPLVFAASAALGTIFVMLAWFGINLLGVGLHSYGFTTGIATDLLIFTVAELGFVGTALWYVKWRAAGPAARA